MKNKITTLITVLFLIVLLSACKTEKRFKISEEVSQIIGGNMNEWLNTMPFDGKLPQPQPGTVSFDNGEQVFPFMAKFITKDGDSPGRKFKQIFYENDQGRNSFAYAALMTTPQEVFLKERYSVSGNIIFDPNALNTLHSARLNVIQYAKKEDYKCAIYWIMGNFSSYISGMYWKENLIFQFAFPPSNSADDIAKIKEINKKMNLNIEEWNNLNADDVKIKEPVGFWQNPYQEFYNDSIETASLYVKTVGCDVLAIDSFGNESEQADYAIIHKELGYRISLKEIKTDEALQDYEAKFKDTKSIELRKLYSDKKLFFTKEETIGTETHISTEFYFWDNRIIKIDIRYPKDNPKAKETVFDTLYNLRNSLEVDG